ncbi:MAG: 1-acyl-sn-glycerol-3-phosphate acyltransferase [Spirochaetes bacterium]|nr:1-acyl-sn-glycerol-3-phosphate acyltransferase [Spirochaetota bacterium]MBU0955552.1 1-acyl-sn-glycerol-3-phosphate acyltransferase [Spirochaetota bacterium]
MLALMSLFTWFEIALCFLLFIPIQLVLFVLTALFDRRRVVMHYHSGLWCAFALWLSPLWKVKIQGREHLDRSKPHVVIMNHQSLIDVLIAFRLFYPVKMIGKKILGFVPIIGWNLFLSGHLLVDRKNQKSQFDAIRRLETLLQKGDSLLVFPEGTRTRDGELGEFKKGAFRSASSTGTSLLPVVIDGPYQVLPRKGFNALCRHPIYIHILPPILVSTEDKPADLALRSREVMDAELQRIRSLK